MYVERLPVKRCPFVIILATNITVNESQSPNASHVPPDDCGGAFNVQPNLVNSVLLQTGVSLQDDHNRVLGQIRTAVPLEMVDKLRRGSSPHERSDSTQLR